MSLCVVDRACGLSVPCYFLNAMMLGTWCVTGSVRTPSRACLRSVHNRRAPAGHTLASFLLCAFCATDSVPMSSIAETAAEMASLRKVRITFQAEEPRNHRRSGFLRGARSPPSTIGLAHWTFCEGDLSLTSSHASSIFIPQRLKGRIYIPSCKYSFRGGPACCT